MKTKNEAASAYVFDNFYQDTVWAQETKDAFLAGVEFAQQWYSGKDDTPEINEKILLVDSSGGTALQIATPYIVDELKRKNGRYAMWRYVELK